MYPDTPTFSLDYGSSLSSVISYFLLGAFYPIMLSPIQTVTESVILTAVASILAAAIGALLGSYATYRAQKRREREKGEDEIRKLRIGLRSELMQIRAHSDKLKELVGSEGVEYDVIQTSSVSTSVYESNVEKISMLSEREIALLSTLYNKMSQNNETLRASAEASLSRGYSLNIDGLGDYPERLSKVVDAAISEIESKLDEDNVDLDLINSILDAAASEDDTYHRSDRTIYSPSDGPILISDESESTGDADDTR